MNESIVTLPDLFPKQKLAWESAATDILYGGSTRSGKNVLGNYMLIRFGAECPGFEADVIRKNWDDVKKSILEGDFGLRALLDPWVWAKQVEITEEQIRFLFNGSRIYLRHLADERAQSKSQGLARDLKWLDECTQIDERSIRWERSWTTTAPGKLAKFPERYRKKFPFFFQTGNPIGPSQGYYRTNYVKARPKYEIEEVAGFLRQYIPARVEDNPFQDAKVVRARLAEIGDAETADALLNENWDALVGDFIREYNYDLHSIPDLIPPDYAIKWRAYDAGGNDPDFVLWFAIADGRPWKTLAGESITLPRGAIVVYREWNGCDPEKPAKGLGLTEQEICQIINSLTTEPNVMATVTDSWAFARKGSHIIANEFLRYGVPLSRANTDRELGWKRVKSLFRGRVVRGGQIPMLYICEGCRYLHDYVPQLQRHKLNPNDAVEDGEATHACDTLRIGCMVLEMVKDAPPTQGAIDRYIAEPQEQTVADVLKQIEKDSSERGRRRRR